MSVPAAGEVAVYPLPPLVYALAARTFTGILELEDAGQKYAQWWHAGLIVAADSPLPKDQIARHLLERKAIDRGQAGELLARLAENPHLDPFALLVRMGALQPADAIGQAESSLLRRATRVFALPAARYRIVPQTHQRKEMGSLGPHRVIHEGIRDHYDEARLDKELAGVIAGAVRLKDGHSAGLDRYGFDATEMRVVTRLASGAVKGAALGEAVNVSRKVALVVLESLWSCHAIETGAAAEKAPANVPVPAARPVSVAPAVPVAVPVAVAVPVPVAVPVVVPVAPPPEDELTLEPMQEVRTRPPTAPPPEPPAPEPPPPAPAAAPAPAPHVTVSEKEAGMNRVQQMRMAAIANQAAAPSPSPSPSPSAPAPVAAATGTTPPASKPAPAPAPAAPKEAQLSPEEIKRQILAKHALMSGEADHFQLLDIPRTATSIDIKKAYFHAAKTYHPDRLANIGLGDLRAQVEQVFSRLSNAYNVLSDDKKRKAYMDILAQGGEAAVKRKAKEEEELALKILKAEECFVAGESALKRQQLAIARDLFTQARDLNPTEPEHHAALAWVAFLEAPNKTIAANQARQVLKQSVKDNPLCAPAFFYLGMIAKMVNEDDEATKQFTKVIELRPQHGEAQTELRFLAQKREKDKKGGGLFGKKKK